jgi:hypothetical protein
MFTKGKELLINATAAAAAAAKLCNTINRIHTEHYIAAFAMASRPLKEERCALTHVCCGS